MNDRDYGRIPTERPHAGSRDLDRLSPSRLFDLMNAQDAAVVRAVRRAKRGVLRAVDIVVDRLSRGGRLYLVGAGTSGRLCVLEAAECPPTFNTPPRQIQAVMAGGRSSVFRSREGAEDDPAPVRRLFDRVLTPRDAVVAVAASGVTAHARAALAAARRKKAAAVFLTGNPGARPPADARVVFATGPEILTGSTRLKAGTATKMILNMLTTMSMVRLGKVHGQWMVDLQPRSRKLAARGRRLIVDLGGATPARAAALLRQAGGRTKTAILMAGRSVSRSEAEKRLKAAGGRLREAMR
ncbi:MAG: N-acetylmuramic acid 6-phosphate etherase [Elusimicrobia bacterium]|jgi:N-acetylmuramic acid 6-phosphate etherase|nr:N-acetylmuramic acid 6-phosphate etherase [Elusimicrobiota bacterium]